MTENEIATIVIGEAIDIHRQLGPGLLEKVYVECLHYRLLRKGFWVEKEKPIAVKSKWIVVIELTLLLKIS